MQYSAVQCENVRENKNLIRIVEPTPFYTVQTTFVRGVHRGWHPQYSISYYDPLEHFESCPWSLTPLLSEVFHLT